MINYIFLFAFIIFIIYASFRWGSFLLSDLITGFTLLIFFTNFHFNTGYVRDRGDIILNMVNLFFYFIIFVSSLFIYFDKENEKRMYFIFPIFAYLIFIIIHPLDFDNSFGDMFLPVFLAFFPLYFLKYYKKYIKQKE